ncbi:MAG TPA: NACHT domain-containing protein [Chthoniobacterales bacterium]|nr:NACHT domain-containing protein [Chthoniobacterales bacterium]
MSLPHDPTMSLLEVLISVPLGLLTNRVSESWQTARRAKITAAIADEKELQKALVSLQSLREEVARLSLDLARTQSRFDTVKSAEPLRKLLSDPVFHINLTDYLSAGDIGEGERAKAQLLTSITDALIAGKVNKDHLQFIREHFFETIEKALFAHSALAHWRHQLSLQFLQGQVAAISALVSEQAGIYSAERKEAALDHYASVALKAWDIIDLSNLPEGDVQISTQAPLLRQLYVPLRITVEAPRGIDGMSVALDELEARRERQRRYEAAWTNVTEEWMTEDERHSVGQRLETEQRLIVLGDPGAGKTTLLRWMATAYLLRHQRDQAYEQLPDTVTLPDHGWIPILIRCRDLGEADLCRSFQDFLAQHFRKSELPHDEAEVMRAVVLESIVSGGALLLVDGLDEISSPVIRAQFCQELERVSVRYPNLPVVVTSRIVGYRDMPYRLGAGFEHTVISQLLPEEKNEFCARWIAVTEERKPKEERERLLAELREAIHSNNRIERLTGNPLLLTTLALVKRKVGRLPNRRIDLYREAVPVLLNWNPRVYTQIEEREAMPQLVYLAYEMCRRGIQRLTEDEVIQLLERVRKDYPNIRIIKERTPDKFLKDLEARSSILIQSGGIWEREADERVYEFRHLTIQEYLAARALLDGRYPDRQPLSLAAEIAPLAGNVVQSEDKSEYQVAESWHEPLRLVVAGAKDDDVDTAIQAILRPLPSEVLARTVRPRAVLAAWCLVDEPNVSEETIELVFNTLAAQITTRDGLGSVRTSLDAVAMELGANLWRDPFCAALLDRYLRGKETEDSPFDNAGGLLAMIDEEAAVKDTLTSIGNRIDSLVIELLTGDQRRMARAALAIMECAYEGRAILVKGLIPRLLDLLDETTNVAHASAWALSWLAKGGKRDPRAPGVWTPNEAESKRLLLRLMSLGADHQSTRVSLITCLGRSNHVKAVPVLAKCITTKGGVVTSRALEALARLGGPVAEEHLKFNLVSHDPMRRRTTVGALAIRRPKDEQRLLSEDFDNYEPWLDPTEPITEDRIKVAARVLRQSPEVIRSKYEALAAEFGFRFGEPDADDEDDL